VERTESAQRQALARKAFDMLAAHFFKMPEIREDSCDRDREERRWLERFVFGPTFSVVRNFFKPETDAFNDSVSIRNLPRRHERSSPGEKQTIEFLLKLANFLWTWKSPMPSMWGKSPEDQVKRKKEMEEILATKAVVDGAKPWMIEVLEGLRELRLLGKWKLDAPCLAVLKKIALRSEFSVHSHPVIRDRKAKTIDEACYLGSQAAWLIKRHELAAHEHRRLDAIVQAARA
jgi:hypothetical protein